MNALIVTEGREGSALPTTVKRDLHQVEIMISVCFGVLGEVCFGVGVVMHWGVGVVTYCGGHVVEGGLQQVKILVDIGVH